MVTWEQYSSLHDKVNSQDFNKAEGRAEYAVRQVIGPRFDDITSETYGYDQFVECICNVIDKQAEEEAQGAGKGVQSASNDGYSVTFKNASQEELNNETAASIKQWLSGTGLVRAY